MVVRRAWGQFRVTLQVAGRGGRAAGGMQSLLPVMKYKKIAIY